MNSHRFFSAKGYSAHRNEQRYVSGLENPDVSLSGIHCEVKRTESLRLYEALYQAIDDANGTALPAVFHRKDKKPWVVIMRLDDWLKLYRNRHGTQTEHF